MRGDFLPSPDVWRWRCYARRTHFALRRRSLRAATVLGAAALIAMAIALAPGFAKQAHAQYPWARSSPSVVGNWPTPGPAANSGYPGAAPPSASTRAPQERVEFTTPHPAVARIIVDAGSSISYGSGTLVDVTNEHGLVLTNWHVVRDAPHNVQVQFPDGFRSAARVAKYDKDWDLAALAIWRPPVEPVQLAAETPRPGDALSIAGYGSGNYRMGDGRCTQFVSPGTNFPFEMIEVSVEARQGDSGGPILNSRGELAGVLFGASTGTTAGSHVGRVRQFLSNVAPDVSTPNTEHIARARDANSPGREAGVNPSAGTRRDVLEIGEPPSDILADARSTREAPNQRSPEVPRWANSPPAKLGPGLAPKPYKSGTALLATGDDRSTRGTARLPAPADGSVSPSFGESPIPVSPDLPPAALPAGDDPSQADGAVPITWRDLAGKTLFDQAKTLLAVVGLLSLLVFSLRLSAK